MVLLHLESFLLIQGILNSFLQHRNSKALIYLAFLIVQLSEPCVIGGKDHECQHLLFTVILQFISQICQKSFFPNSRCLFYFMAACHNYLIVAKKYRKCIALPACDNQVMSEILQLWSSCPSRNLICTVELGSITYF